MAAKKSTYSIEIDAKTTKAVAGIKDVGDESQKSAKKVDLIADALESAATKGAADLADVRKEAANTEAIFQKLVTAVGDDLGGAVAAADLLTLSTQLSKAGVDATELDADIDRVATSLVTMGQNKQEAEQLATELQAAEQAAKDLDSAVSGVDDEQLNKVGTSAGTTRKNVDDLRDSSDQTKSVMANMAGNTAQDLGAVGGAAGSAGVAIGQLAEYATEGNISMGGLAKLAGPMLGLAAVGAIVGEAFAGIKLEKEFNAKRVDEMTTSLRETGEAASFLREEFEKTGKIEFVFDKGGFPGVGKEVRDITKDLGQLGLTYQQFDKAVRGGRGSIDQMAIGMKALREAGGATEEQSIRVVQAMLSYEEQLAAAEAATALFNQVNKETPESAKAAADAFLLAKDPTAAYTEQLAILSEGLLTGKTDNEAFALALEQVTEGTGLAAEEVLGLADDQNELAEASAAATEKERLAEAATRDLAQANKEAANKVAEHKQKWDELFGTLNEEKAYDNVTDSLDELEDAAILAYDAAMTGADDAAEKQEAYTDKLLDTKTELATYIEQIEGLPPEVATNLIAKLDAGKIAEVRAFIDNLRNGVDMPIRPIVQRAGGGGFYAGGTGPQGVPQSGFATVGEQGAETIWLPKGTQVDTAAVTSRNERESNGDTYIYNTYQYLSTATARDVRRAERRAQMRGLR